MLLYITVSQQLGENYPFSHYPMYSNPSAERHFFVVTDDKGEAFPIVTHTGVTAPQVGKILRKKLDEYAKDNDTKRKHLTPEDYQIIGKDIFDYLREQAALIDQTLPAKLQLRRNEVGYEDGHIIDTSEIIAQE